MPDRPARTAYSNVSVKSQTVLPAEVREHLAEKRRPAVIVSGAAVAAAGSVWIAMITSARNARIAGDVQIGDFPSGGLGVASVVRPLKIACIEPTRILRRIGALPTDAAEQVRIAIGSLTGSA